MSCENFAWIAWSQSLQWLTYSLFFTDVNFDEYDKSDDPHDYKFVRWLTKEKVGKENLKVLTCHGPCTFMLQTYWFCSWSVQLHGETYNVVTSISEIVPAVYATLSLYPLRVMVKQWWRCLCNWHLNSTMQDFNVFLQHFANFSIFFS